MLIQTAHLLEEAWKDRGLDEEGVGCNVRFAKLTAVMEHRIRAKEIVDAADGAASPHNGQGRSSRWKAEANLCTAVGKHIFVAVTHRCARTGEGTIMMR